MRYGNTSGNIANGGYVAYDQDTKKHILSRNQGVYFFDPEKNIMEEIFSIELSGSAEYINTSENWIYYINSDNGNIIRRSKEDYSITETIYDGKATYLDNYNIYLYFLAQEDISRFYYFKESKEMIKKTNINQVSMMSSFGTNIFYYKNTSSDPSAYWVSGLYCGEKTTLVKFDKDFLSIENVLAYGEFSNAMIVEKKGVSGLYLYDQGNLLHSITSDEGIQEFSSINYDGNYFYFIGEKNENRLIFKLDPESYELREYVTVPADGSRLSIINNWMYLKKMGTNKIYQLAPDTEQFKLLD